MGLFSSKTKTTNDVKTTPQFDALGNYVLSNAQNVFGQPFKEYDQQRYAKFGKDELQGFAQARNFADPNSYTAGLEQSALEKFATPPSLQDLDPYMNPFTQGVLDRTNYNLTRSYDAQRAKLNARQASGGAYGGSRFAVQQGELDDSLFDALADTNYRGLSDAFTRGQDMFYKTGIDAMNLSQVKNKSDADRFNALLNIGGAQRGLKQQNLDFDYQEFMRSINEPKQDLLSSGQLLSSYPVQTFDTVQKTKSTPSAFSIASGLAGAAMSAFGIPGGGALAAAGGASGAGAPAGFSAAPGGGMQFGSSGGTFGVGLGTPVGTSPFAFGTTTVNPTILGSSQYSSPTTSGITTGGFQPPGYKDGGLVKKNPFDRKITVDPNPFKSKNKSKIKTEKALQFADGGVVNFFDYLADPDKKQTYTTGGGFGISNEQPQLKPQTKAPDIVKQTSAKGSAKNPFVPQISQPEQRSFSNVTVPEIQEQESFMDRWMNNPLTQIGIALMQGSGPEVLGGFGNALAGNYEAREMREDSAREEQQKRQIDAQNEQQRRIESANALEVQKQRYAQEYSADMARVAVARETNKTAEADLFMRQLEGRLNNIQNARVDLIVKMQSGDPTLDQTSMLSELSNLDRQAAELRSQFNKTAGIDSVRRYNPETRKLE